jgi:transcriptional regulator of arginine metabolism
LSRTAERRRAILQVLQETRVRSQDELAGILAEKGFETTQPMLSRDLRNLKVAKRDGVYQLIEDERVTPLEQLAALLRGAQAAGPNLLVVHCEPGAAHAVARALEAEDHEGVIGSVAGDDTIFLALTDEGAGAELARRVRALLEDE